MAVFYREGEQKTRPGVYQRVSNAGGAAVPETRDGICAIPVRAIWGPVGQVIRHTSIKSLEETYGTGSHNNTFSVPAAAELFRGGASVVYTYRLGPVSGTGAGTCASKALVSDNNEVPTLTVTAKYPGSRDIKVAVREKLGATGVKQLMVYASGSLVEVFDFASGSNEGQALFNAVAAGSDYITVTLGDTPPTTVPVTSSLQALEGGLNPTVTNTSYSEAFAAFEPYFYNVICLDVDDEADQGKSWLLKNYLDGAYEMGKLAVAVVGEKTTVTFSNRCAHAKAFNDPKVVYLGGGWKEGETSLDGALAICRAAGVIAATPVTQGITHTVLAGATDLCESLTYAQYEEAIRNGMLLVSRAPDGSIWFDSAVNTLVKPDGATQDDGWKKIRRTRVRFELMDRLDRALAPKVGRVSADSDGLADVVQTGQRVLDTMAGAEGKLMTGASFQPDPDTPYEADSAWFVIQADDIDSLEKIYLHYRFRYTPNA